MGYIILSATILLSVGGSVSNAVYGRKKDCNAFLFSAVCAFVSALFFICYNRFKFTFDSYTLWISSIFAVAYIVCSIASIYAVRLGSIAITSMFSSFSLLLPTLFGILYWKEPVKLTFCIGILLFCGSVILVNLKGKAQSEDAQGKNKAKQNKLLWIIAVVMLFFSNGTCSITQTFHQKTGGDIYKAEFMIIALAIVFSVNFTIALLMLKRNILTYIKSASACGTAYGLMNAGVNLGVMLLASKNLISSSVFFPVISIGSLVMVFAVSYVFFKERFERVQYVGILLGIGAIVLLQI